MKCAVLGHPITHSLSPALHRAGYVACGLDWAYDAVDVTEEQLATFLDSRDEQWRGLSLTMPLKRTLVGLVDWLDPRAEQAQAANTLVFEEGRRLAYNTDIPGAVAAIREQYDGPVESAVVVGGGATAASVLLALADLGCRHARLVVRSVERAADTLEAVSRHPQAPRISFEPIGDVDIVVSTIPADAQSMDILALVPGARALFDVIYDPWPTPLATMAAAAGLPVIGGLDLLVHQAALQFELFTGRAAPVEQMRAAGTAALAARSH